uniref:Uncharacterized protein n=1 Tax=Stomoxys calcitrans TaxID=35570 RepID=A0A1I8NRB7_STOCA
MPFKIAMMSMSLLTLWLPSGKYLFDHKKSYLAYIFAYLWDIIAVYALFNTTLVVDTLFSWFAHNICAHFRILNWRFKCAGLRISSGLESDDKFHDILTNCISYHQNLIKIMKEFNNLFRMVVFVKFAISCIQLAFLAFQFARGGDLVGQVFHLFFLLSVSSQLMLYCYGGQRIQNESLSVADGIYQSFRWQELSVRHKKLLLIPLIRSQRRCSLTGIFFVADLPLFLWVF